MQMLQILVLSSVLALTSYSEVKKQLTNCINASGLNQRASQFPCDKPTVYHYIWSGLNQSYIEICYFPQQIIAGHMGIVDQNSYQLHAQPCPPDKYQPEPFISNEQCGCKFKKSKCDKEGQKIYSNGNETEDRTCNCDKENGYVFNNTPSSILFCIPKEDDCTCVRNSKEKAKLPTADGENITKNDVIVPVTLSVIISLFFGAVCGVVLENKQRIYVIITARFTENKCTERQDNNGESEDDDETHNTSNEDTSNVTPSLPASSPVKTSTSLNDVIYVRVPTDIEDSTDETRNILNEDASNVTPPLSASPTFVTSATVENYVPTDKLGEKVLAPLKGNYQNENVLSPREDDLENGLHVPPNHGYGKDDMDQVEYDIIIIHVKDDQPDAIRYVEQLERLNSELGCSVTINLLSRVLQSKDQFKETIRPYRHILLFLSSQFSIGKLETEIDISHLKECYFQDPFNVDRVKIIKYDNSVNIPDELSGLNTFQNIVTSEAHLNETYLRMMENYFRVMMFDRQSKE